MSNRALAGFNELERLGRPVKRTPPQPVKQPPQEEPQLEEVVVRVPRTTPVTKSKAVANISTADSILSHTGLAKRQETEWRREQVLAWMLNGHLHDGSLCTVNDLAISLDIPLNVIQQDVAVIKEKMAEYHTTQDLNDIPAMAHMLMEMKFQDRGRALKLYNIVMGDISAADAVAAAPPMVAGLKKSTGLTGRDRAAMYGQALAALDLSNKATNGMESLFKLTGGAKRLADIISKAQTVTINNISGNVVTMGQLQDFVSESLGAVLPSSRKVQPQLALPRTLELDADDIAVIGMAGKR